MRILILSDLHREHWKDRGPQPDLSICQPDVVVLAGDIATGIKAVAWAAAAFPDIPVLYVNGNHEGYGDNLDRVLVKIAEACQGTNVHFLNCDAFYLDDVMFIGATLWSDFNLYGEEKRGYFMLQAQNAISDYRGAIRLASKDYRKLTPQDTAGLHQRHKKFIERRLCIDPPHYRKAVVISHMAPSRYSIAEQYEGDTLNPYYASNLDPLVCMADLWIHGHTHTSFDYKIGTCRVVCNPCGYPHRDGTPENIAFNPNFIVEI
jgi:predicted phosphodiesterase